MTKRSVGRNRLALILFGALFVVLFVGFAIAEGIGSPERSRRRRRRRQERPATGDVTEADFKRGYAQQSGQSGLKKVPKAGAKKTKNCSEAALGEHPRLDLDPG